MAVVALAPLSGALLAHAAATPPTCRGVAATIVGTYRDDTLVGTDRPDVIMALRGDDTINGRGGADIICAGRGRDSVRGGGGDDHIIAGLGRDAVAGDDGDDVLVGRDGEDTLRGGPGRDQLVGGAHRDEANGGAGRDRCSAETMISCNEPPPNRAPVAGDDAYTLAEDGSLNRAAPGVLADDSDPDGDALQARLAVGPTHGTLTLHAGGAFSYVPDANFAGADSFTYRVSDGVAVSAPATVTLTITPINDPITDLQLSNDTVAENEPSGTAVGTLAADDDDAGDTHTFSLVTGTGDDDNGQFVIDGATLRTTAAFDAESEGPFSVRIQANDGTAPLAEAFAITVTNVNDAPTLTVPAAQTTAESTSKTLSTADGNLISVDDQDAGSNDVGLTLAVDEGTLTLATLDGLTFGTGDGIGDAAMAFSGTLAKINAALDGLVYDPVADYFGADTLSVTIDDGGFTGDGGALSDADSVALTVTSVNSAPVNSVPSAQTFDEDTTRAFSTADGTLVSVVDVDAGDDPVEVTLSATDGALTLAGTADLNFSAGDGAGDGTATFSGTIAAVNDALDGLVYAPDANFNGAASLTVATSDLGNNGAGGVLTDTDVVNLTVTSVNDAPAVTVPGAQATDEDAPLTLSTGNGNELSVADVDAGADGVEVTIGVAHGTLTLPGTTGLTFTTGDGTDDATAVFSGTTSAINTALDGLVYTPTASYAGDDTLSASVDDGGHNGSGGRLDDLDSVAITVNATNAAPVNSVPGAQALDEDTAHTFSTGNANAISVSDSDAGIQDIQVSLGATRGVLTLAGTTGLDFTCTACAGDGTNDAALTFVGTLSAINTAMDGLTFTPDANDSGAATFTIATDDLGNTGAGGAKTDSDVVGLTITAINDAPVNTVAGPQTVDEDTNLVLTSGMSTADADAGSNPVEVDVDVAHGTVTLGGTTGLTFTRGDGTSDAGMTFGGTISALNTALASVTYRGDLNYAGSDTLSLTTDDQGNSGSGGALTDTDVVSITVTPVNDAPVADDETFDGDDSAIGNTTMIVDDPDDGAPARTTPKTVVTGDIFAGDTDIDSAAGALTATPGTFATNDGGAVTIESDGDFVFQPAASTSCTDTSDFFDYTVEDNGSPEQTDTGRVTISIAGCVWYVHNNSPGNSGTANAPYDTLAQAETSSGANHTVFVFDGDNTATGYDAGGYAMNSGERLIGEHEGLTVDPDQGGSLTADTLHPANAGAHPTLTSTGAGLDVIDLDDGNEIRGFNIDPQNGHGGIQGSAGDTGGGTIDDVNIVDTFGTDGTQAGLQLNDTTGTFNVSNFTVDNNATGVLLHNAGTVDFGGDSGVVTLDSTGGAALSAAFTNMGTSTFDDIITSSSPAGGVILNSASGTTNLGDGSGTDLNLTTISGTTPALSITNSGTVIVGSGGTDELHATGGPALDVAGTSGGSFDFDDVDSTNSANDGINLDGLGTGSFQAAAGDISGAAGLSFDLNGGSGTILYQGNLNNGTAPAAIDISGRTGGTVTLSGPISDTNDTGGGLVVSDNTGGSTTLSSATKQFNTGASPAVTFANSDGHMLNLIGNNLDIDTTSGEGLVAVGAGTLHVAGTGNTITATALAAGSRGVNIADTDIAAADVTFQSIATSGGVNGIRINNTGTAGNLNITGTGANDSGGTIANTSGSAIELQGTDNFTADEMHLSNPARDGVGVPANIAGNVTNFTFTDSTITNAGQSDADITDSAFAFNTTNAANENNLDGVVTITGNTITNPYGSGVDIFNHNGTISDLFISNNTMTSGTLAGAVAGTGDADSVEDGIQVVTFGGSGFAAQLSDAEILNNNITGFPDGSGIELLGGSQGTTVGRMGTPGNDAERVEITGNDIDGHSAANPMLSGFIVFDVEGRAQGHARIANNGTSGDPMTNVAAGAIAVGGAGDGGAAVELELHVLNNFLTAGDTPLSAGGSGIGLGTDKDTIASGAELNDFDVQAAILNNTVLQPDGSGIRVLHRDSFGHLDVDIRGNTVGASNNGGNSGIRVENGSSGNATYGSTMCARIGGTLAGDQNAISPSGPDGFGDVRPGITLVERDFADPQYEFRIDGLSPSPSNQEQAEAFVEARNANSNLGSGFWAGERVAADNGTNWHSCAMPLF